MFCVGVHVCLQRKDLKLSKTGGLDLSYLTTYAGPCGKSSERINQAAHSNGPQLDDEILADPEIMVGVLCHGQGHPGQL